MQKYAQLVLASTIAGIVPALGLADILSSKRGLGDVGAGYNNLQATGAGWYYTWGTGAASPGTFDANHYPMFWGWAGQSTIDTTLAKRPTYILGYNEPERTDQANMSVATAISNWTTISNSANAYNTANGTSIKLVSPAVADTGGATGGQQWLANFMSQANSSGLKVDAVAFHWYGVSTPSNPSGAASSFLSRVDSYHNSYGKPVFITEFAIHDWGGAYTDAEIIEANRQFLEIVIPGLESRSYVAGYAWYNWFSDSPLYSGDPMTPTQMGYRYVGAVMSGQTQDAGGKNLGEHVAYLAGGTLTQTGTAATMKYVNALANTSTITGAIDWGLNASTNWTRVQPGATLRKYGSNTITFGAGTVANDGALEVTQGVLRMGTGMSGFGSINITSTGDATGSTARLELTGNNSIPNPITFAQRNDPGASDGIRNVSGINTLSGPLTITVGGNQARVRSDAGTLNLAGRITTNATSARNFYLQGAGNGVVSGVIADNPGNSAGKINLNKEGAGVWTLTAPNTYTGATTISAGVLRIGQISASSVTSTAVASYSFDTVNGLVISNDGTGGTSMNGALSGGATIVSGGQAGNAVSLANGASVNINNPIVNMGNTSNWTMTAWVKTATAGGSLLTKGAGSGWAYGNTIFYLGDGSGPGSGAIPSSVRWAGGFFQGSANATPVTDNTWHQITYVNSAGSFAIYVDGVAQTLASNNSGLSVPDVGTMVRLGISTNTVSGDGTLNYNGLLDGVQFYSQALSAAQVAALFRGGSTGILPPTTDLTIAAGATLDVNGTVQQVASLSGPAGSAITLGAGQLVISSSSVNSQFAGSISGVGGSLVKSGSSMLTLSGSNTYTGPTTINQGVLKLTASAFAPVTTGTGAILNGGKLIMDYTSGSSPKALLVDDPINGLKANAADPTSGTLRTTLAADSTRAIGWLDDGATTFQARFTYKGDIDLSGVVDSLDFNAFLAGYGMTVGAEWANGDFDYAGSGTGKVDSSDFNFLAGNFGLPLLAPLPGDGAPQLGMNVPEPGVLAAVSFSLLFRQRLSRRRAFCRS
jgi:autotransporter-associated beta strand protein